MANMGVYILEVYEYVLDCNNVGVGEVCIIFVLHIKNSIENIDSLIYNKVL